MSNTKPSTRGTAVVTGASSGIGKVYADRLASRGYDLLLIARRADRLADIAADLQQRHSVHVEVFAADLVQPADLLKTTQKLAADTSITLLVNNAGTSNVEPVSSVALQTVADMVALNITALTALTSAVLPNFIQKNAGTLINIGSVVGFAGYPWVPVYGGTKAYVLNFSQALKLQLAETAIRIQLVAPSGTVSEIWDTMGITADNIAEQGIPLMTTEDCVDAALKGLDAGEFITAPSVQDEALIQNFEAASNTLLAATQNSQPASRYGLGK